MSDDKRFSHVLPGGSRSPHDWNLPSRSLKNFRLIGELPPERSAWWHAYGKALDEFHCSEEARVVAIMDRLRKELSP